MANTAQSSTAKPEDKKPKPQMARWIFGWVVIPTLVLGAIFGFGVQLGVMNPDAWYSDVARWCFG